jgi:hypothetical protein
VTRLPREQWHTLILDAHPGYITWPEYEDRLLSSPAGEASLQVDSHGLLL